MFYNPQITKDRIDQQIAQLQQMKDNLPIQNQSPSINQTFQLAPQHSGIKYVNSIDDVRKEIVYSDTPYFSNDLSILWIKNSKGDIRCYELKEIVEKDQKDLQIEYLMGEIDKLKGMIKNEQFIANDNREDISTGTSSSDETIRKQIEDDKSSDVQRISRSKKK